VRFLLSRNFAELFGKKFPCTHNRLGFAGTNPKSSCADLVRASTPLFRALEGVGAHGSSPWAEGPRAKPGQDEGSRPIFEQAWNLRGMRARDGQCPIRRGFCAWGLAFFDFGRRNIAQFALYAPRSTRVRNEAPLQPIGEISLLICCRCSKRESPYNF
jgi:hypothetical protein